MESLIEVVACFYERIYIELYFFNWINKKQQLCRGTATICSRISWKLFRSPKAIIMTLKPPTESRLRSGKLLQRAAFDMFALGDFPESSEGLEWSQRTYRLEIGEVYLPSQLERTCTTTLYMMVDISERGWACTPPSPAWADFSIIIECTPESSNCHSVYSVDRTLHAEELTQCQRSRNTRKWIAIFIV